MKRRPLIELGILAAGIVVAGIVYAGGGDDPPAPSAASPPPEVIGAPAAAPRIAQPALVPIPALPRRPHRTARSAPPRSPSAVRGARPRSASPKPSQDRALQAPLHRSRPKPVPLEPPLLAPPE
jgi:hypothetical protein